MMILSRSLDEWLEKAVRAFSRLTSLNALIVPPSNNAGFSLAYAFGSENWRAFHASGRSIRGMKRINNVHKFLC